MYTYVGVVADVRKINSRPCGLGFSFGLTDYRRISSAEKLSWRVSPHSLQILARHADGLLCTGCLEWASRNSCTSTWQRI